MKWAWFVKEALRFLNRAQEKVADREARAEIRAIIVRLETLVEGRKETA